MANRGRKRKIRNNLQEIRSTSTFGCVSGSFGARHDIRKEDIWFMLLRGVGPHLHPRTESSGVVWGRPSPPALDSSRRGAMCRSRRGACRGRRCPLEPWPSVDRAPRSNSPAPAVCCASKSTNAERAMAVRLARTGAGPVVLVLRVPLSMARAVWSSGAGPRALCPSESGAGA